MKLENNPVNLQPSPPRKSYNPFDSDDDALDSPNLKSTNMFLKESGNDFDLKAFDKSSDKVIFHMDNGDFLWEEAVLGQPAATGDHSTNMTGMYTDKNVTECELPEFVICYKESNIKDIGIDEGVPSHEKLWIQSGEDEDKNPSAFLSLSGKTDDVMKIEESNDQLGVLDVPKSTLGNELQKSAVLPTNENLVNLDELNEETLTGRYLVHEFGDDDLVKITELQLDVEDRALPKTAIAESASGGLVSDVALHHDPGTGKETDKNPCKNSDSSLGGVDNIDVIQTTSEISVEQVGEISPKESLNMEEGLANPSDNAAIQESVETHDANKLAYNSKVESRSITFNFGSSASSKAEKQEDEPQNPEAATPPATQTMTRQEEGISGSSILASSEGRVHGESSFSAGMPVPLPSSITFSEPLTYSGSISLRSESSAGTGSTRSFAFPVLQADWNTSPTRMGKGPRRMKKHRGWKALGCCKF